MDVFLIRHAEATDETLTLRDPMRHLTAHGRAQARHLGDRLRWHDCSPTTLWTSPLVRAVQTAELIVVGLQSDPAELGRSIDVLPALAPGGSARDVVAAIEALPADASVVLVGHVPGLSAIGALLAKRPDFRSLAKAEAARIVDGELRWRCAWDAEAPVRG